MLLKPLRQSFSRNRKGLGISRKCLWHASIHITRKLIEKNDERKTPLRRVPKPLPLSPDSLLMQPCELTADPLIKLRGALKPERLILPISWGARLPKPKSQDTRR